MNRHDPSDGLEGQTLSETLHDAVSDVEPVDRLAEIRGRTTRSPRRRWAASGAVLVAAAAAVAVALVVRPGGLDGAVPEVPVASDPVGAPDQPLVPVYYVGPGATGPDAASALLYRYFERGGSALDRLMRTPSDPDYRTLWPAGSLVSMSGPHGGVVDVTISDAALRERPTEMTAREAELAIQQVVYTVQADVGGRPAVQFRLDENPIDQVFGEPTSEALTNASVYEVLSLMSISDPAEGATYRGSFTARGAANSFEASVLCSISSANADSYGPFIATAEGSMEERLFPWEMTVDLSDVPSGRYTFTCSTSDPTGGSEGRGTDVDTRTIVVE